VPSCFHSKRRTCRPNCCLCHYFRRSSAAQEAGRYCALAERKRHAWPEELLACELWLTRKQQPRSCHVRHGLAGRSRKTKPRGHSSSQSGVPADRRQSWKYYRERRCEFRICLQPRILRREPEARWLPGHFQGLRAQATSTLPISARARRGWAARSWSWIPREKKRRALNSWASFLFHRADAWARWRFFRHCARTHPSPHDRQEAGGERVSDKFFPCRHRTPHSHKATAGNKTSRRRRHRRASLHSDREPNPMADS